MQIDSTVVSVDGIEPVSIDYVKNYIRQDYAADDDVINLQITAAREIVEKYIDSTIVDKTLKVQLFDFQEYDFENGYLLKDIPYGPNQNVSAVAYINNDGEEVAITNYTVYGLKNKRIKIPRSGSLLQSFAEAYNITFTAGMGNQVPNVIKDVIAKIIAHLYETRGVAVYDMSVADIPLDYKELLKPFRRTFI